MNKRWLAMAMAGIGLCIFGAAEAYSKAGAAQLAELGREMQLSPAQQTQWQQVMGAVSAARAQSLQHADERIGAALEALKVPGADLSQLMQPEADGPARAARQHARDLALAFYSSATPQQQTQMRNFLSQRLTRAQSFLHRRAEMAGETG
jgi:hypothetical protein